MHKWLTSLLVIALGTSNATYAQLEEKQLSHLYPSSWPGEWSGSIGLESRVFFEKGSQDQENQNHSAFLLAEYFHSWNGGRSNLLFKPFVRLDQEDSQRTHWDIRELSWSHRDRTWSVRAGIGQVHWGVTEVYPIVDTINQLDAVEESRYAKQGQPLVNFTQNTTIGTFDIYALFDARQRTYPGERGRLRFPISVDNDEAREESSGNDPFDMAIRWKKQFSDLSLALSHFKGISRDPRLIFNFDFDKPRLIPVYEPVNQTSIEIEYLWQEITFKLEALTRTGDAPNYDQAKGGFEYTWASLFNTDWDLTGILEYIWDSRKGQAPTFLDQDYLIGVRLFGNDIYNTQARLGYLYDDQTREQAITLEFGQDINDHWSYRILASAFFETDPVPTSALPSANLGDLLSQITTGSIPDIAVAQEELLTLLDFNIFVDRESAELQQFIGDLALNGDQNSLDPNTIETTLDQLYRMGDPYRKLNLFQQDDFIQFEITRHF